MMSVTLLCKTEKSDGSICDGEVTFPTQTPAPSSKPIMEMIIIKDTPVKCPKCKVPYYRHELEDG
jgi:hypothetical protein